MSLEILAIKISARIQHRASPSIITPLKKGLLRVEKVYYRGIIVHSNIYFLRNEVHFPSKETKLNR